VSNTFGNILRLTTFGESHGKAIGGIIDGYPPNIIIDSEFIQSELNKRKPNNSEISTQRKENDKVEILSGIFENKSLGTPIGFIIPNYDIKSTDYKNLKNLYRPGHADFTYQKKYGIRDYRGGGRSSARETANWVVAGAFAKIMIKKYNIQVNAYTKQIGNLKFEKHYTEIDLDKTYSYSTRCPDNEQNKLFEQEILNAKKNQDSVGGIVSCIVKNTPVGIGEPVFDKMQAQLAKAVMSINACKGFEIGQGFNAASLNGSYFNDEIFKENNKILFKSNNSGGVLGGITTGQDIIINAAFKPTSSIEKEQQTIDNQGNNIKFKISGRHDPCVVPRAVIVVESVVAMVIADFILMNNEFSL